MFPCCLHSAASLFACWRNTVYSSKLIAFANLLLRSSVARCRSVLLHARFSISARRTSSRVLSDRLCADCGVILLTIGRNSGSKIKKAQDSEMGQVRLLPGTPEPFLNPCTATPYRAFRRNPTTWSAPSDSVVTSLYPVKRRYFSERVRKLVFSLNGGL
jgi:hypothetical protein